MPYINKEERIRLEHGGEVKNPGHLNYVITVECLEYLGSILSYSKLNEIIGVLECVKMELYRRVVAEYEDVKMKANGDVYYGCS